MKKILLALFILTSIFGVSAQDSKLRFGITSTPGLSWLSSERREMSHDKVNFAWDAGLKVEYAFADNFSLATGVAIGQHGGTVLFNPADSIGLIHEVATGNDTILMKTRKYAFRSIDIPVGLKLKTPEIGYLTYWIEPAFVTSFAWKSWSKDNEWIDGNGATSTLSDPEEISVAEDTRLIRFALNVSAGVEYNLAGNTSLLLGLRYGAGITSTLSSESEFLISQSSAGANKFIQQSVNSNYMGLTVGVLF